MFGHFFFDFFDQTLDFGRYLRSDNDVCMLCVVVVVVCPSAASRNGHLLFFRQNLFVNATFGNVPRITFGTKIWPVQE